MNQVQTNCQEYKSNDFSSPSNNLSWILWRLPILALISTIFLPSSFKIFIWPISLGIMGASCSFNASKCKRRECFVNGPYYLMLAILSYLHASNIVYLGDYGWYILGAATAFSQVNIIVIEKIWGRYLHA
jgi:hypothetical protein